MKEKKFNLSTWIKTYPTKFLLLIFIIIIPILVITLLIIAYVSTNKRFYFDEVADKPVYYYQRDINNQNEFNTYFETFEVTLNELVINKENDEITESYIFSIDTEFNNTYRDATLTFKGVLATDYYDKQSNVVSRTNTNDFTLNYPFDHLENKNKLLVFGSGIPNLYLEVKIDIPSSNLLPTENEPVILIYKLDLTTQNYNVVD